MLQAQSAAVESTGQAKAEAQSRAEAARIEGETAVQQAKLKAEAAKIEAVSGYENDSQDSSTIGHFGITFGLFFKASPGAHPFI